MPSSHDAEVAMRLLQDPVFAALAEEAVHDYIDWDELTRRPPGLGQTPLISGRQWPLSPGRREPGWADSPSLSGARGSSRAARPCAS